jgi:phospholipid N-methyltransferase
MPRADGTSPPDQLPGSDPLSGPRGKDSRQAQEFARIALDQVADVPDPNIVELGSSHGSLSRELVKMRPTAQVTVTDIDPTSVAAIAASNLGRHPRAVVREMDASAIDAPDGHYDLAVFALALHHLPPPLASQVFAEGTRVADKLLIIDLPRLRAPLNIVQLAWMLAFAPVSGPQIVLASRLRSRRKHVASTVWRARPPAILSTAGHG